MAIRPPECPVCQMTVATPDFETEFLAITYRFCSRQCLERFRWHPRLYIGDPGHGKSQKQKGHTVLKRHRIVMAEPLSPNIAGDIQHRLAGLMGTKEVSCSDNTLWVIYDLLEVSLADIEAAILSVVGDLDHSLIEDLKRKFIHCSEECELENLAHPDSGNGCH